MSASPAPARPETGPAPWVWVAGLVLITLAVYAQTATFQFVNFDDPLYVQSPIVRPGLTPRTIAMAFTRFDTANWYPLTWLSLLLDRTVFGLHPAAFHVHNVLLHVAGTLVLFQTLREATGQDSRCAFVAALFAIHPLHVESVAWIAERKDVLSGLFWMLTLWCYGRYARQPPRRRAGAVFVSLLLGLMAKPMLVTLPCVLLLWDVWPLRRWSFGDGWSRLRPLLHEKLPLFALSAVFSVVAFVAQRSAKAVQSLEMLPLEERLSNAIVAYVMYPVKTFWPFELAVYYPYTMNDWPWPAVFAAAVGLLVVTAWCVAERRDNPVLLVGWLWYLGSLVPVIGLVQVGSQAMADRYTYLPLIGIFLIVAWGVPWRRVLSVRGASATAVVSVALLSIRAYGQVGTWQNSATLFEHAVRVVPSSVAYNNLGLAAKERQNIELAERLFRRAMVLDPRNVPAWTNLGAVRLDRGDLKGAEEVYREALRIQPRHVDTLISYGGLLNIQGTRLEEQGQADEAAKRYRNAETLLRRAASLAPESPVPRVNLGLCLQYQQRWDDAVAQYHRALALGPDNVQALHNLGSLHVRRGRPREAIAPLERALSLSPGHHISRVLLAKALAEEQDFDRALRELANVLKAEPDFEPALTLRDDIRRRRATE